MQKPEKLEPQDAPVGQHRPRFNAITNLPIDAIATLPVDAFRQELHRCPDFTKLLRTHRQDLHQLAENILSDRGTHDAQVVFYIVMIVVLAARLGGLRELHEIWHDMDRVLPDCAHLLQDFFKLVVEFLNVRLSSLPPA